MSDIFLPKIIKICLSFFKSANLSSSYDRQCRGCFFCARFFCLFQHIFCLIWFP